MMTFQRKMVVFFVSISFLSIVGTNSTFGEEKTTIKQKMEEDGRDFKRGTSKAARKTKDEVCELVDGKMSCMAKKTKHSIQNAADDVEDAVD